MIEICVPNKQIKNVGHQDGSVHEALATNPADLSSIPKTHKTEERIYSQVEALTTKPADLNSIPETHMTEQRIDLQVVL